MRTKTLHELAARLPGCKVRGADCALGGVALDSRLVEPGFLFAALPGALTDGLRFIAEAEQRGAAALLLPAAADYQSLLPALLCDDPRQALGLAAHLLADEPARDLSVIGVTGTNGKTSSVALLRAFLAEGGSAWGLLGSIINDTGSRVRPSTHTTVDAPQLATLFAEMRGSELAGAVMEVSSHALVQKRVAGLSFAGALFSNISRDHLDYHGDMDSYLRSKMKLLEHLADDAPVVYNADCDYFGALVAEKPDAIGFSHRADADFRVLEAVASADHTRLRCLWRGRKLDLTSPLLGAFNVENVAGAAALALALGTPTDQIASALVSFAGVPGRMERYAPAGGPLIIVDYAHTPDAVARVLSTGRSLGAGRVIALLGAGGDRDRGKRPLMAAAAQRGADLVCLTSDNPRGEDPRRIIDDMVRGLDPSGSPWVIEIDRERAIRRAAAEAAAGDVLFLLGKGHEEYVEVDGQQRRQSDRELARAIVVESGAES